jgi:hypothetical protein
MDKKDTLRYLVIATLLYFALMNFLNQRINQGIILTALALIWTKGFDNFIKSLIKS